MNRYTVSQAISMLDEMTELGSFDSDENDSPPIVKDNERNIFRDENTSSKSSKELSGVLDDSGNNSDDTIIVIISNEDDIPIDDSSIVIYPKYNEDRSINVDVNNNESVDEKIVTDIIQENDKSLENNETKGNPILEANDNVTDLQTRGRKRKRDEAMWKVNIRKRQRQQGKEYINVKGKKMRSREIKTKKDCQGKCRFKCSTIFSPSDRETIFHEFWKLTDTEKNAFYGNTTDKTIKERQRTTSENSRRKSTIKYYFCKDLERIRVCRDFYMSTLHISAKRVEYFYKKTERNGEYTTKDLRGTPRLPKIPMEAKAYIREHINSFPRIPSHYCRASSCREYLEPDLSVSLMYRLYKDKCINEGVKPQTRNAYRKIFNTEFNLSFLKPKKDRCDICEEYKVAKDRLPISGTKYQAHINDKLLTYQERDKDRQGRPEREIIVCFDMQNVIQCPRSNVSNFFYERKLNVFNMTGHVNKIAYNIIWNEVEAGQGSNELASAVCVMLQNIIDNFPETEKLILWSDSCVAQNRNSIMCYALKLLLQKNTQLKSIVKKFCTPGHSSIQEVDNIHSHIEKKFKVSEIYSPLGVIRKLKQVRPDNTVVIQLREDRIFDFQSGAAKFHFKEVPFSKVKCLQIERHFPFHVFYKTSFSDDLNEVTISRKTRAAEKCDTLPLVKNLKLDHFLSAEKKKDIKSMLRFMPQVEMEFMQNLCKITV